MFDLTGKTALVTGATQGIGLETAKLLASRGAKVYVGGSVNVEKCQKVCKIIDNAFPAVADLTKPDCAENLHKITGNVDILVLNASIQYKRKWDEFSEEELQNQLSCNLTSSYQLIKKYVPYMKNKKWGRIVTVGSVNQYNNHPELSVYGVTKAAQKKLVENIAADLAPYGVTINNIAPGAIATPRNEEVLANEEVLKKVVEKIPCGYIGRPEDIAPSILLLCSEEGRYITGADLKIDGGMSL